MTRTLLLCIFLTAALMAGAQSLEPPYSGTLFVDPDVITEQDSSVFESCTYIGRGMRTVFDRRANDWVQIHAYLFDIQWKDGLHSEAQVNPEFGSPRAADHEARKYGIEVGRLPYCLRVDIDALWIHMGTELFGGGNRSILIHTGQSEAYEADGLLGEALLHEGVHTSLDSAHLQHPDWLRAQEADGGFISTYARDNPGREDVSESFPMWFAIRYRTDRLSEADRQKIQAAIPGRLRYFDALDLNLSPISASENADTTFIFREITPTNYHAIYIERNRKNEMYTRLKDFSYNHWDLESYEGTRNYFLNQDPNAYQTQDLLDLPLKWLPLYAYQGQFYLYAPGDWGNTGRVEIEPDAFVNRYMDGPSPEPLVSVEKVGPESYKIVRGLRATGAGAPGIFIHFIGEGRRMAVFEYRGEDGPSRYELYTPLESADDYEMIVNYSSDEKPLEFDFDKFDFESLLGR